jgi:hypothetical protein
MSTGPHTMGPCPKMLVALIAGTHCISQEGSERTTLDETELDALEGAYRPDDPQQAHATALELFDAWLAAATERAELGLDTDLTASPRDRSRRAREAQAGQRTSPQTGRKTRVPA